MVSIPVILVLSFTRTIPDIKSELESHQSNVVQHRAGVATCTGSAASVKLHLPAIQCLRKGTLPECLLSETSWILNYQSTVLSSRSYSYQIEVSMDNKDWIRIVNHTHYLCRSWQYLCFPARVARYCATILWV